MEKIFKKVILNEVTGKASKSFLTVKIYVPTKAFINIQNF